MTDTWYDRHVLPWLLDWACGVPVFTRQRALLIPQAQGRVLEVGLGTGRNLPHYDTTRVQQVVGVDPALRMHRLARRRAEACGLDVALMGLSAERLPVPDASFDTVVSTYTLCSIPDPVAALREMRRVLKPGGRLLFSEHGRAPDPDVARWQTRLNRVWKPVAGGCHLDRDIPALLAEAGFAAQVQSRYLWGPRVVSFHHWGSAVAD